MTEASIDLLGIGNAIVDVITHTEDAFLAREGLVKGTMALIDAERADELYRMMGPAISCGNNNRYRAAWTGLFCAVASRR